MKAKSRIRNLAMAALFIALNVVLTRFLAPFTGASRLGIGLLPIHLGGYLLGPIWGFLIGLGSDLLGIMINPQGTPHLGITLTMALRGLLAGLIAYYPVKIISAGKILLTNLLDAVLCSGILMTFFVSQLLSTPFQVLLLTRSYGIVIQFFVLVLLEIVLLPAMAAVQKEVKVKRLIRSK